MTRKRKPRSVPAPALTAGTSRATADTSAYRRWWPVLLAALAALGIAAWLLLPHQVPPAALQVASMPKKSQQACQKASMSVVDQCHRAS